MDPVPNPPDLGSSSQSNSLSHQQELESQKALIKTYESQLSSLFQDFNYNVQLIYDRDKEIESLHSRIDELMLVIREKDMEIINLKNTCKKVKQLEADKLLLNKRLEAFINSNNVPKPGQRKVTSKQEVHNSPYSKAVIYHKGNQSDRIRTDEPVPLTRINSDLERRIKALEEESVIKKGKGGKSLVHDKISMKEKEISELIKSLSPYKKEQSKHKGFASLDFSSSGFIKDVQRIEIYSDRPGSRLVVETDESSVRCVSSLDDHE